MMSNSISNNSKAAFQADLEGGSSLWIFTNKRSCSVYTDQALPVMFELSAIKKRETSYLIPAMKI
jgi:hypothetical protein